MTIFASVIHKEKHRARYANLWNPYEIALHFCMERLHTMLTEEKQHGKALSSRSFANCIIEMRMSHLSSPRPGLAERETSWNTTVQGGSFAGALGSKRQFGGGVSSAFEEFNPAGARLALQNTPSRQADGKAALQGLINPTHDDTRVVDAFTRA